MRLNDKVAGFPEWPPIIEQDGGEEIVVEARYIPFGAYVFAEWIVRLAIIGYAIVAARWAIRQEYLAYMFMWFAIWFVPAMIVAKILPLPWMISYFLLMRTVRVHFTAATISIGGKEFDVTLPIAVHFQAMEPHLHEDRVNEMRRGQKLSRDRAYELKFQKVEMIYGARLVPIVSIADQKRAGQFVLGLQIAFERARTAKSRRQQFTNAGRSMMEDDRPE